MGDSGQEIYMKGRLIAKHIFHLTNGEERHHVTGFSYLFSMGHGPYIVTILHGSWAMQRCTTRCTTHDPWVME
jgi:hypothetical protein